VPPLRFGGICSAKNSPYYFHFIFHGLRRQRCALVPPLRFGGICSAKNSPIIFILFFTACARPSAAGCPSLSYPPRGGMGISASLLRSISSFNLRLRAGLRPLPTAVLISRDSLH